MHDYLRCTRKVRSNPTKTISQLSDQPSNLLSFRPEFLKSGYPKLANVILYQGLTD